MSSDAEHIGMGGAYPDYDAQAIEKKWQRIWDEEGTYRTDEDPSRPKRYVL